MFILNTEVSIYRSFVIHAAVKNKRSSLVQKILLDYYVNVNVLNGSW